MALKPVSDAIVIVDVLSFSTAVDIALSQASSVLPYRWNDASAKQFAAEKNAILADSRTTDAAYTLSPASLRFLPPQTRLVLPSPNGATLALEASGIPTFTACLRNAPTVAKQARAYGSRIAVVPAGERWSDNSLRPCLEDLIGAGSVLAELPGTKSPEAEMAIATFERFRKGLSQALLDSESGEELTQKGFGLDIELAAEYAISSVAPMLVDGWFLNSSTNSKDSAIEHRIRSFNQLS